MMQITYVQCDVMCVCVCVCVYVLGECVVGQ